MCAALGDAEGMVGAAAWYPGTMPDGVVRFGLYRLDLGSGALSRRGVPVRLGPQPARLLALLVARAGTTVGRDEIRDRLWADRHIEAEGSINYGIHQVRRALGDDPANPVFVETVAGRGYRFIAPLETSTPTGRRWRPRRIAVVALGSALAASLALALGIGRPPPPPALMPAAREALLEGLYLLDRQTPERYREAVDRLQRATRLAPASRDAWLALGRARFCLAMCRDDRRGFVLARDAARRALAIDPRAAEAHARLATVALYADFDWPRAEAHFQRALTLDADAAEVRQSQAFYLASVGRLEEAVQAIERALRAEPVSTRLQADVAWVYYLARRWQASLAQSRRTLALEPAHPVRLSELMALEQLGRWPQALAVARVLMPSSAGGGGRLDAFAGDPAAGVDAFWRYQLFDTLTPTPPPAAAALSGFEAGRYLHLGLREAALAGLERAAERRPWPADFVYLGVLPELDPLRAEPRFEAVLEQVGIPRPTP